jgi:hypothetical protein
LLNGKSEQARQFTDSVGNPFVALGPVHGDLNSKNMFLELPHFLPFLIDFASFHVKNHVLLDYAMIESAIKFALLGREADYGVDGKDLDVKELPKWLEADEALRQWPKNRGHNEDAATSEDPLERAFGLCAVVRNRARNLQRKVMKKNKYSFAGFCAAYDVALLYHSCRAIGYSTLPHVKRIFAAMSAYGALQRLLGDS